MKKNQISFSLFDFCKKRADKVEIYGQESMDENGEIIPFIDQAAYVTFWAKDTIYEKQLDKGGNYNCL